MMNVTLRYFEGCPHWQTAHDPFREALRAEGMANVEPVLERVDTAEKAERLRFIGSPTILVDGRDPFAGAQAAFGLTTATWSLLRSTRRKGLSTRRPSQSALRVGCGDWSCPKLSPGRILARSSARTIPVRSL